MIDKMYHFLVEDQQKKVIKNKNADEYTKIKKLFGPGKLIP